MFTLTDADHKRASFSCSDQCVRMILVYQYDHIGAHNSFQSNAQCFLQRTVIIFLNVFNEIQ